MSSSESEYNENSNESEAQSEDCNESEAQIADCNESNPVPVEKAANNTRFKLRIPKYLLQKWQLLLPADKRGKKKYEYGFTRAINAANVTGEDFQKAKNQSLIVWGPDVWLAKLAETGCGQLAMYSGRGQSVERDLAQTKFVLDMVAATNVVAGASKSHVADQSTVPEPVAATVATTTPGMHARHSQGIHDTQGIHKAFMIYKAFTRHS